jgi:hypothetical protein
MNFCIVIIIHTCFHFWNLSFFRALFLPSCKSFSFVYSEMLLFSLHLSSSGPSLCINVLTYFYREKSYIILTQPASPSVFLNPPKRK